MQKNLILVDDHAMLRDGIKHWFDMHSVFRVELEAGTWQECDAISKRFSSGELDADDFVAVVDISFKRTSGGAPQEENTGFEIIRTLSDLGVKCVAFSSHDSGGFVEQALSPKVGAKGFVSKTADEPILLAAVEAVASGKTYVQAELVAPLLEVQNIIQTFTKKERLVADEITPYNTNADIARSLGLSEKTILNYLCILYDKTGTQTRLQFLEKMGRL